MTHTPTPWTNEPGKFFVCGVGLNTGDPGVWSTALPPNGEPFPFGSKADDAERMRACVNFFHGRDIATENIPEGGFWEMVAFIKFARDIADGKMLHDDAQSLLTKLGVDP